MNVELHTVRERIGHFSRYETEDEKKEDRSIVTLDYRRYRQITGPESNEILPLRGCEANEKRRLDEGERDVAVR